MRPPPAASIPIGLVCLESEQRECQYLDRRCSLTAVGRVLFFRPAENLIAKGLSGLKSVLNPLLPLALRDETEKRLALQIEQSLLGHRRWMRHIASRHDRRQLAADERIVIADAPAA